MGVDWASDPAKILENSMFLLQENFRTWKTHPETCMPIKILRSCLVHKHQYIHVNIHVKWTQESAFFHPTRRMQVLAASDLGNGSFWGKKSFSNAKYTQKLYANILSSCLVHKNVYSEEIFNTNGCWLLQTLQRSWKILCFYCKKTSGHEKHTQKHVCQLKSLAAV